MRERSTAQVGVGRWLIAAAMLTGCHAYQRARLAHLVVHPLELLTTRWFWIAAAVLIVVVIVASFLVLRRVRSNER